MKRLSILVFGLAAVLSVYLNTTNQIFSFDAITNAIAAESEGAVRWFHPNHPLYPFGGVLWYKLERLFGYDGLAVYSLARFNSILTVLGLGMIVVSAGIKKIEFLPSMLTAVCLAFSYGVWHYAVDGRAIGTSLFFGSLVLAGLSRLDFNDSLSRLSVAGLGILSLLYIFSHGIAIFHVAAVSWWLGWRTKWDFRPLLIYGGVVGMGILVVYATIFALIVQPQSQVTFFRWAIGYAGYDRVADSPFWSSSVVTALSGLWVGWKNFFVMSNSAPPSIQLISASVGILVAGFLGVVFFKKRSARKDPLAMCLFLWGLLAAIFLSLWSPGQEGFRIHIVLPWSFLLVYLMGKNIWFARIAAVMATVFLTANLHGSIGYASTISNNRGYQELGLISKNLKPGDLFLCAHNGYVRDFEVLRPYFFPSISGGTVDGRLFAFRENSLGPLEQRLRQLHAGGAALYFGDDLLLPESQNELEKRHRLAAGDVKSFLSHFNLRPAFPLDSTRTIYEAIPH